MPFNVPDGERLAALIRQKEALLGIFFGSGIGIGPVHPVDVVDADHHDQLLGIDAVVKVEIALVEFVLDRKRSVDHLSRNDGAVLDDLHEFGDRTVAAGVLEDQRGRADRHLGQVDGECRAVGVGAVAYPVRAGDRLVGDHVLIGGSDIDVAQKAAVRRRNDGFSKVDLVCSLLERIFAGRDLFGRGDPLHTVVNVDAHARIGSLDGDFDIPVRHRERIYRCAARACRFVFDDVRVRRRDERHDLPRRNDDLDRDRGTCGRRCGARCNFDVVRGIDRNRMGDAAALAALSSAGLCAVVAACRKAKRQRKYGGDRNKRCDEFFCSLKFPPIGRFTPSPQLYHEICRLSTQRATNFSAHCKIDFKTHTFGDYHKF